MVNKTQKALVEMQFDGKDVHEEMVENWIISGKPGVRPRITDAIANYMVSNGVVLVGNEIVQCPMCGKYIDQRIFEDGFAICPYCEEEVEHNIDAVPVVRCQDCEMQSICKVAQYLGNDGFCSKGGRRDDDA